MTDDEERNLQRLADLEEGLYRKKINFIWWFIKGNS